jgi:hypothetical protein
MTNTAEVVMEHSTDLLLIGRRERVGFPEWELNHLRAKIDTGAYSSVLDVKEYELIESEAGMMVRLQISLSRRRPDRVKVVQAPVVGMVSVRNSGGKRERRPLIEPLVRLGPITRRIRLTVTNRSRMRCRMLLGRHALAGQFLVDVAHKDLL